MAGIWEFGETGYDPSVPLGSLTNCGATSGTNGATDLDDRGSDWKNWKTSRLSPGFPSMRAEFRSHRFVLIDASGKDVATLKPLDGGACLDLYAPSKSSVLNLCSADKLGSTVSLVARNGETHVILSTGELVTEAVTNRFPPGLVVATHNGERTFSVRLGPDLKVILGDPSGKNGFVLLVPNAGQPVLKAGDEEILPKSSHYQSSPSSDERLQQR